MIELIFSETQNIKSNEPVIISHYFQLIAICD